MKRFILSIFIVIVFIPFSFAGEWDTDFLRWGIGVLNISETDYPYPEYQHFIFPMNVDIPIFESPDGAVMGTLFLPRGKTNYEAPQGHYSPAGSTQKIDINAHDLRQISYDQSALIFFEEKNGFVKILHHSLKKAAWLRVENLKIYGLAPIKWMDFMMNKKRMISFNPPSTFGMNLRSEPLVADNKLVTMKGDLYDIRLTGVTKGLWAEVKVELYDVHPCEGDNKTLNSWTGWVKLMDDSGYPNIWFYTGGC